MESDHGSIAEWLSPIASELDLYRCRTSCRLLNEHVTVRANWKNGADNFIDALHVRVAHPGLNGLLNKTYGITAASHDVFLEGQVKDI